MQNYDSVANDVGKENYHIAINGQKRLTFYFTMWYKYDN